MINLWWYLLKAVEIYVHGFLKNVFVWTLILNLKKQAYTLNNWYYSDAQMRLVEVVNWVKMVCLNNVQNPYRYNVQNPYRLKKHSNILFVVKLSKVTSECTNQEIIQHINLYCI